MSSLPTCYSFPFHWFSNILFLFHSLNRPLHSTNNYLQQIYRLDTFRFLHAKHSLGFFTMVQVTPRGEPFSRFQPIDASCFPGASTVQRQQPMPTDSMQPQQFPFDRYNHADMNESLRINPSANLADRRPIAIQTVRALYAVLYGESMQTDLLMIVTETQRSTQRWL